MSRVASRAEGHVFSAVEYGILGSKTAVVFSRQHRGLITKWQRAKEAKKERLKDLFFLAVASTNTAFRAHALEGQED